MSGAGGRQGGGGTGWIIAGTLWLLLTGSCDGLFIAYVAESAQLGAHPAWLKIVALCAVWLIPGLALLWMGANERGKRGRR